MDDYVQYHNSEKMQYSCLEFREKDSFRIFTWKPATKLIGQRVWLMGGISNPRKYYLCYNFIVDTIDQTDDNYMSVLEGKEGIFLNPPIFLNDFYWFKDFLKSQQNFSFGLRKIDRRYVQELEKIISGQRKQPIDSLEEIEKFQPGSENFQDTERQTLVQSRIGQEKFRGELIQYWGKCAITGCQKVEMLRASHIKPWSEASDQERLDKFNGLLLIPNLDAALDAGYISFDDDGKIMISRYLSKDDQNKLGIHPNLRINGLAEQHIKYFQYHRKNKFKGD